MAFGFPPEYNTDLSLDDLTQQQFVVIATNIAQKLEWEIRQTSDAGLIAFSSSTVFRAKAKITIQIADDQVHLKSECTGSEVMDLGRNKKIIDRFLNLFYDAKYSFSPEEVAKKYEELKPDMVPPEQDILSQPPQTLKENKVGFLSLFIPKEGYFITPLLIDINIVIFILMVLSGVNAFQPDNLSLLAWGANFRPSTLDGEWWRLLTNIFLHVGIMHLLLNMYALVYIGLLLEPYLGKLRFAMAYLLTGVIASLTSLYWHDLTISAGASGAIFGMYGLFLALLTTNFIEKTTRKTLLTSIAIFVGYNLIYGLKGGIDNAAHIGGLVSGFIIGYLFYPGMKNPTNTRLLYFSYGASLLFALTTSFIVYHNISDDIVTYQKRMNDFAYMEQKALSIYTLPNALTKSEQLSAVRDSGIYYWNKNIKLLREVEKLKVPAPFKDRTQILIDYCNARIASYNYLYRKIDGNTGSDEDSTKYYNHQIREILHSLKVK